MDEETDLGIIVKNNLKIDSQCAKASKKGNQGNLGINCKNNYMQGSSTNENFI